jgi:2-polyprenyl-3-methyl-5-hydroxy-6-metoxy-1,4-benzoquinol methylase
VVSEIKPDSVLDVGCGPGIYVQSLLSRSVAAIGIDSDERADGATGVKREDLFVSSRSAELVLCLEVAEHIEPERSEELVVKMFSFVRPGGFLIWSAAHPGQGGVGHINCQAKEYWEELLTAVGFARCENLETKMLDFIKSGYHMGWFAQNAMLFTAPAADGVNGGTSD